MGRLREQRELLPVQAVRCLHSLRQRLGQLAAEQTDPLAPRQLCLPERYSLQGPRLALRQQRGPRPTGQQQASLPEELRQPSAVRRVESSWWRSRME